MDLNEILLYVVWLKTGDDEMSIAAFAMNGEAKKFARQYSEKIMGSSIIVRYKGSAIGTYQSGKRL